MLLNSLSGTMGICVPGVNFPILVGELSATAIIFE